jgi:hypothetical protein
MCHVMCQRVICGVPVGRCGGGRLEVKLILLSWHRRKLIAPKSHRHRFEAKQLGQLPTKSLHLTTMERKVEDAEQKAQTKSFTFKC